MIVALALQIRNIYFCMNQYLVRLPIHFDLSSTVLQKLCYDYCTTKIVLRRENKEKIILY